MNIDITKVKTVVIISKRGLITKRFNLKTAATITDNKGEITLHLKQ